MIQLLFLISLVVAALPGTAAGGNLDQRTVQDAIAGIQQAKVYFDVNVGDEKKLLLRLHLIDETLEQMKHAGVAVQAVIGFRGGASRFVTRGDDYVLEEEVEYKRKIHIWIERFANADIPLEQCEIAADLHDIERGDFLAGVDLVPNGYVSLIGYQNKGYAVIAMD